MSAVQLTDRQREVLRTQLERAICWREATVYHRDEARRMANTVIAELERAGFASAAQRRAIEKVVIDLAERSA